MCPCFFSFSVSFSTAGCRWMGIGLPFCCISFDPYFNWISTSTLFTVWFFVKSLWNLLFSFAISSSGLLLNSSDLFMWLTVRCGFSVFSVIPSFSIQLSPSNGCVCLEFISNSSCHTLPSVSMSAMVLPSNFLLLSFTSR